MSLGLSFLPSGDDPTQRMGQDGGSPSGLAPLQSAIRLLSMRIPRFGGPAGMAPGGMAPNALMQAPGAAGMGGGNASLEMILKALMGMGGPGALPGSMGAGPMGSPGRAPSPRVTPGSQFPMPPMPPGSQMAARPRGGAGSLLEDAAGKGFPLPRVTAGQQAPNPSQPIDAGLGMTTRTPWAPR